jgi:hypothetical protein
MVLGLIVSKLYFNLSESGVPKDSNCSYLAPASTDYLAILAGGILVYRSKDPIVKFIGSTILGIHYWQLTHKK